ncbi:MAG: sugar phosphate isomerase/epimerase [Desulfobacterales bacterium]|nr:sugar phosphate isomerase/epimerase [Desulfobacterales bacterium]
MRYGAMNFPVNPVMEEIEAFAELGFDYLELTLDPPKAHYTTILESKDEILGALKSHGMGIVCHLPTFIYTADLTDSIRRASVNEMLHSLDAARELGASKVVLHPGGVAGMGVFVVEMVRRYALESIEAGVAKADQLGLTLCLENMFPGYGSFFEPREFIEVFERFPSIGMTLDIGHANIKGGGASRTLEFIRRFGDRIRHLHVSDNGGRRDEHLSLRDGNVDFLSIIPALQKIGYDDTVTLEVFSQDRRQLKSSRESFAAMSEPRY